MDRGSSRRTWGKGGYSAMKVPKEEVRLKDDVPGAYDEYLLLLQERNRIVRKLKEKDSHQKDLEQKEQGFSIYVNGANTRWGQSKTPRTKTTPSPRRPISRKTKTAGETRQTAYTEMLHEEREHYDEIKSKTAPARRKNWLAGSVQLKTHQGSKLRVRAPDEITGNYDEDFEDYVSESYHSSQLNDNSDHSSGEDDRKQLQQSLSLVLEAEGDGDSDLEIDAEAVTARHGGLFADDQDDDNDDEDMEEINEQLMLSIQDVKNLRRSMELNQSIQQSIAEQISSDSEDGDRFSDISEEDIEEEIPEDVTTDEPLLKADDIIVLEFAPKKKETRDVSSAKSKKGTAFQERKTPHQFNKDIKAPVSSQVLKPDKHPHRLQRPLSASRKSQQDKMDNPEEAHAVLEAMKAENKQLEQYAREVKSAPTRNKPHEEMSDYSKARSKSAATAASQSHPTSSESVGVRDSESSESQGCGSPVSNNMDKVLKKILQMDSRQQKKLIKVLGKIEKSASPPKEIGTHQSIASNTTSVKTPRGLNDEEPVTMETTVTMEILSNWGHPSCVGLTEIQLFDLKGQLIDVEAKQIKMMDTLEQKGNPGALVNGKYKTTKDRNMWSCSHKLGQQFPKIQLKFPSNPSTREQCVLSSIKIWNYNKSLNELPMGVKNIRLAINDVVKFEGTIEKGCGNQVFDYSKTIHLCDIEKASSKSANNQSLESVRRSKLQPDKLSKTFTKMKSGVGSSVIDSVTELVKEEITPEKNSIGVSASQKNSKVVHKTHSKKKVEVAVSVTEDVIPEPVDSSHGQFDPVEDLSGGDLPRCQTRILRHSTDNVVLPVIDNEETSENASVSMPTPAVQSTSKSPRSPKMSKKMPANLRLNKDAKEDQVKNAHDEDEDEMSMLQQIRQITREKNSKPKWLAVKKDEAPFEAPPESRQSHRDETSVIDDLPQWPAKGTEHLHTVLDEDRMSKTPELMADDHEEKRWREKAKSDLDLEAPPMKQIESAHNRRRMHTEDRLEESWSSLSLFNKSHKGRLSVDYEDDVLDEYLGLQKAVHEPTIEEEEPDDLGESFIIPELPCGQQLVINIKTTWGDRHYVGLNGIEIFSSTGQPVAISSIWAKPSDINVLGEYDKDPRVVSNLLDGVNRTRDDIHMWLVPFTAGGDHLVYMAFEKPCQIALMRIWNYNKSRIHSYRGAKDIEMTLDDQLIFKGDISRACGGVMGGTEAFGDTILFTMDEEILEAVSHHDEAYEGGCFSDDDWEEDVPFERPSTADEGKVRPHTGAVGSRQLPAASHYETSTAVVEDMSSHVSLEGDVVVYTGQSLELNFTATWGDLYYLGLTSLEVVDREGKALPLTLDMMNATPRDLRSLSGCERDDRILDKLIDSTNVTSSDEHMWMIPFTEGGQHTLTITFPSPVSFVAIRVWNYNKNPEDTFRGARIMHVSVDGRQISPPGGYLLRKGPGHCYFDFAQEIPFSQSSPHTDSSPAVFSGNLQESSVIEEASQEYDSVQMPYGFIFQLQLLNTWGDPYYIGLNGLEIYDACGNKIDLTENNISAYPESINVLEQMSHDVRTPDKLIDGVNTSMDGQHMWLAPILPGILNRVFVIFDQPVSVSMIKLWNYSKTFNRGVKDFALLVDDLLIYSGQLGPVQPVARGILPTCDVPQPYHTILFTDKQEIVCQEKHTIISKTEVDQDVQLTNDHHVVGHYSNPKQANKKQVDQGLRPKTSVTKHRRK